MNIVLTIKKSVTLTLVGFFLLDSVRGETGLQNVKQSDFEFKTLSVFPAGDGKTYHGKFSIKNMSGKAVAAASASVNQDTFEPMFVSFQKFEGDRWLDVEMGYSGFAMEYFSIKPGAICEFETSLFGFTEQAAPLMGRIGIQGIWSESFILNWKIDRKLGRFEAARLKHLNEVRELLVRSGFNKQLLNGDDFCDRLIIAMLKETSSGKAEASALKPFSGNLIVTPNILSSGLLEIDFSARNLGGLREKYSGILVINPRKFSLNWLKQNRQSLVSVVKRDNGVKIQFGVPFQIWNDKTILDYTIIHELDDVGKTAVDIDSAKNEFMRMIDILEDWLKE